jgi:hypothetical protein
VGRGDETGKEKQVAAGSWAQIAKGIYKGVSNFQNLISKQNLIEFKRIIFKT